ncbi:type VII secretion protein EccB, partial [Streptomyces coelicoflavus]
SALCAQVDGGDGGARIGSVLAPLTGLAPVAVSEGTADPVREACVPTDATVVRPGHGALVRALHASGAAHAGTTYLVAENGVKYRVPADDTLRALGYTTGDIDSVPAPLLAALPTGADLDPDAASGAAKVRVTAPDCEGAAQREEPDPGQKAEAASLVTGSPSATSGTADTTPRARQEGQRDF